MSVVNNLFNIFGYSISKAKTVIAPEGDYRDYMLAKIGVVQTETVSAVYRCINIIATYISILPVTVMFELQKQTSHPLYYTLQYRPAAYLNPQAFWSVLCVHYLAYGNAFARIIRNQYTGQIYRFEVLHPYWIAGYNIVDGELYYYVDHSKNPDTERQDIEAVAAWDLIHIKDISYDGIWGISRLQAAYDSAQILGKAGKTVNNFYDNHAHSTLVIEGKFEAGMGASLSPMIEKSMAEFKKQQGGPMNAGKPIELPWNKSLKSIPVNYVDVQLIETMKFTRDQVYTVFGLPDYFKEGNNQNIEEQLLEFKNFTIMPIDKAFNAEFEFKTLTKAEKIKGIKIARDYNMMLDTDLVKKANAVKTMVTSGTMTPNQGAAMLGNQPIASPFGDLHFVQMQNQPIEYYDQWPKNPTITTETKNKDDEN